jgi:putative PIG3 family NAD(P)H quinone oxidoreductase
MTVIEIVAPGGPDKLQPRTRPRPEPAGGELLIHVAAAGVNRPDALQRRGGYPPPPGASDIPGLEVAGRVEAVGSGTARWKAGDEVCAILAGGGYAEYVVAPGPQCLPIPAGLNMVEAAALPETFFTVWTNVFDRARLREGETLLVHGGTSGIGTTAIQLARAFGARVFTTAGSPEKCEACRKLGADRAIDYKQEDFAAVIRKETRGRGVDVILDMVGGDYTAKNLDLLAPDGRLVQIGLLGGAKAQINIAPILQRRLTFTGSTLRSRSVEEKGAIARDLEARVWPLLASGRVRPIIDSTFPLERAADAHRRLESSQHVGKIVLVVGEERGAD